MKWFAFVVASLLPAVSTGRAILGIDLGSLYMKVALVQSGAPLEIVTNLHSKRKTEQMVLFDRGQRLYGADASALLGRKSQMTPVSMSEMLGRDELHPTVQVLSERYFPVQPVYNESRRGVGIKVAGSDYTPEELVAMVLNHAVDISVAHAEAGGKPIAPPKDVALTVPSFATASERRALLDAAQVYDLNVLTLIEENTAAALHFAMDKNFEGEKETTLLFYNMGASSTQVSVVRFFQYDQPQKFGKPKSTPAIQVLGKAWDDTLGGQAFDNVLVEILADEFNELWRARTGDNTKDIRTMARPMTKIRLQANKVKHVLSANTEIPVNMDAVYDDISMRLVVTRAQFEQAAGSLLQRAVAPVHKALEVANMTVSDLNGTELIGGGMRIPAVQARLQEYLGETVELGLHMNADESAALGAAFGGANISTAFRVRQVGLADITPWEQTVALSNLAEENADEPWSKEATLFKAFGKTNIKKTIAFTHGQDVHCALDYADADWLPEGTQTAMQRYDVSGVKEFADEMSEKGISGKPKVSLQFELTASGITDLVKAEAALEETYTVEEEVEVEDDSEDSEAEKEEKEQESSVEGATETADNKSDEAKDDETASDFEWKAPEKKKKTIKVENLFGLRRRRPAFWGQEKKRVHKKTLKVTESFIGRVQPYSTELLEESKAKLAEMNRKDEERVKLEEAKNRVESYMYMIKNKLVDDEETISKVSTEEQREACRQAADDTEAWLDEDGYTADLSKLEDKFAELSAPFERILLRVKETTERPEKAAKLTKKLKEVEDLMLKWETSMPQVTEMERGEVMAKVEAARKWLSDKEDEQASKAPHEEPAYLSSEVGPQFKPVEFLVMRLSKKPKPTKEENKTETNGTDSDDHRATDDGEASSAETKEEDTEKEKGAKDDSDEL